MKTAVVILWLAATGLAVGCVFVTPHFSDSDQWTAASVMCVLSAIGAAVAYVVERLVEDLFE